MGGLGDWLEDVWNAISTPPGSTTPILAPETIREPEQVFEEEIVPIVTDPFHTPETILKDITGVDIEIEDIAKETLKRLFDMGHDRPRRLGLITVGAAAGLGYILLRD